MVSIDNRVNLIALLFSLESHNFIQKVNVKLQSQKKKVTQVNVDQVFRYSRDWSSG